MGLRSCGQATIEYLLLILLMLTLSIKMIGGFTDFMTGTIGNLGHVLTYSLSVGVCNQECFYPGHRNGQKQ